MQECSWYGNSCKVPVVVQYILHLNIIEHQEAVLQIYFMFSSVKHIIQHCIALILLPR